MATAIVLVVALIFAAIAVGLLVAARNTQRKIAAAAAVPTSSARSVAGMTPGEPAELRGVVRCDAPLTSELAQESCAYYRSELTREYEVRERSTSNGPTRWVRRSESLSKNTQRVPFSVDDGTGSVRVTPDGADIDAPLVVDRLEKELDQGTTLGGVAVGLGRILSGQRTIGYRYTEHIIRVGDPVYVLGVVGEDHGIAKGSAEAKDGPFIISHRSEEELTEQWRNTVKWQRIGGAVCGVIAIVLAIVARVIR